MGIVLILIILAVVILISYIAASAFDEIAVSKGYPPMSYFWYCFWLGLAGWLMVVALPDRTAKPSNQTVIKPANQAEASDRLPKL